MTLPDTSKWLLPADGHLSLEQLRLYQEEKLPASARYQIEKHLLDCGLCADVLAGIAVSNRTQTQAVVIQLNQRIKSRVQSAQHRKARPLYGTMLRVAAALVILLVSFGAFRYWQRSTVTSVPERTIAQEPKAKPESQPLASVTPPPDPVLKPAEPLEPVITKTRSRASETRSSKSFKMKEPSAAVTSAVEDQQFPIDTAAVLDAFAVKTADTSDLLESNPLPVKIARSNSIVAQSSSLAAASVPEKPMSISLQKVRSLTGQTISGKVLDAVSNQGLPGVTVQAKGTSLAITTDPGGNFSLAIPAGKEELVFSFAGYFTQEVKIKPTDNLLTVRLKDNNQLKEGQAVLGKKSASVNILPAKPEIGYEAFEHYIQENLRYPAEARSQKQEGGVEVGFTVTEQGQLTNFKIRKSLSPACDAEAIRVIKEGPNWQPRLLETGSNNHPEAEKVRVTVPFKLQ